MCYGQDVERKGRMVCFSHLRSCFSFSFLNIFLVGDTETGHDGHGSVVVVIVVVGVGEGEG